MNYFDIIIIILFLGFFSFFSLAPFVPTKNKDLERINKISKLKSGETFLEIGCGTAKVSIYLAKKNPNSQIIGIEFSPFLFIFSKIKALFLNIKNLKIIYGNALNLNFGNYDVIYIFGTPKSLNEKLIPKLIKSKKNFRLLSYCFCIENTIFNEIKHKENIDDLSIYEYII